MISFTFNIKTGDYKLEGQVIDNELGYLRAAIARARVAVEKNPISEIKIRISGQTMQFQPGGEKLENTSQHEVRAVFDRLIEKLKLEKLIPF